MIKNVAIVMMFMVNFDSLSKPKFEMRKYCMSLKGSKKDINIEFFFATFGNSDKFLGSIHQFVSAIRDTKIATYIIVGLPWFLVISL